MRALALAALVLLLTACGEPPRWRQVNPGAVRKIGVANAAWFASMPGSENAAACYEFATGTITVREGLPEAEHGHNLFHELIHAEVDTGLSLAQLAALYQSPAWPILNGDLAGLNVINPPRLITGKE